MIFRPSVRTAVLALHLVVSIGWIGAVAAYMALDISAATSSDAQVLRGAYVGMELIARSVIVPLAFASLLTGITISLGTKWGLLRHYWVVISLIMTAIATAVLVIETRTISAHADAAALTTSEHAVRSLGNTLFHSIGGTVVLLVILVLNLYKPSGMTRFGRRKQARERAPRA